MDSNWIFGVLITVQIIGYTLLPNFLNDVGGFSQAQIGIRYSVSFIESLPVNILVGVGKPRTSFIIFIITIWVGMFLLLAPSQLVLVVISFFLFGSLTTMRLLKAATSS